MGVVPTCVLMGLLFMCVLCGTDFHVCPMWDWSPGVSCVGLVPGASCVGLLFTCVLRGTGLHVCPVWDCSPHVSWVGLVLGMLWEQVELGPMLQASMFQWATH